MLDRWSVGVLSHLFDLPTNTLMAGSEFMERQTLKPRNGRANWAVQLNPAVNNHVKERTGSNCASTIQVLSVLLVNKSQYAQQLLQFSPPTLSPTLRVILTGLVD